MANVKITELTALTDPASTDVLPIVDVVADVTKKISIADLLENAGSGTAAAPGIAFDGDSNTGIYRPGADQLAISTNGSQALLIDASGNVTAAGTSTAGSFIPTSSTVPTNGVYLPSANNVALATNGAQALYINSGGDILVADGNRMEIDEVRARDGAGLKLFDDGGAGIFVEDGGNVGVGTSTPDERLNVAGAVRVTSNAAAFTSSDGALIDWATDTMRLVAARNGANSSKINFVTYDSGAAVDAIRIDSDGKVGIGTTSPQISKLHINQGSEAYSINLQNNSSNESGIVFGRNTSPSSSSTAIVGNGETTGYLDFLTGGTDKMRLDSSGRLLVGTSSAANTSTSAKIQVIDSGSGGLILGRDDSSVTTDDTLGYILFMGNDGGSYENCARIRARADGTHASGDKPTYLEFSTTADGASSPTERMRIAQDGFTNIYTNTSVGVRTARTSGGQTAFFVNNGASSTLTGTTRFQVMADGDCENTNNSYTGISDIKLKENIVDANSQWDDIKALQVRNYNFKEETNYGTHTQIGLVAQEVEIISPGLVKERNDQDGKGNDLGTVTKSVNYSVLYMKAVKALQEAMERIETLEAKVATLEA